MPTTSTARQRVPVPDFSRAARLGSFLSAFGWLVVVVGIVAGLFAAASGDGFSVPLFLLAAFGALLVGLVVVGVGRGLEIVAYVGDHAERQASAAVRLTTAPRAPVEPSGPRR